MIFIHIFTFFITLAVFFLAGLALGRQKHWVEAEKVINTSTQTREIYEGLISGHVKVEKEEREVLN